LISVICYKALSFKDFIRIVLDSVKDIGTVCIMIGGAAIISYIVAREGIAANVGNWITALTDNKYFFLFLVNVIMLILGMFIDTTTIQLVFIPIMIPVARILGIDLVHFGVVVTFNMMIGQCTPPFGMLLFIVAGISGTPLKDIVKEIIPQVLVMVILLFILTYVPGIITYIPKLFGLM
jgi:tripartite ATP-independent transporter DctM subunit